jgi:hypothetical protein
MRPLLPIAVLVTVSLSAQPIPEPKIITNKVRFDVTASVTMMPLEIWKATFAGPPKGLALYGLEICNHSFDPVNVQGGLALNQIKGGVTPVDDPALSLLAASHVRRNSTLYKVAMVAKYLSMTGAFISTAGVVEIGTWAVAFPMLTTGTEELSKEFKGRGLPPVLLENFLLNPRERFDLGPGGCHSSFVMGAYRKNFVPFEVPVM